MYFGQGEGHGWASTGIELTELFIDFVSEWQVNCKHTSVSRPALIFDMAYSYRDKDLAKFNLKPRVAT